MTTGAVRADLVQLSLFLTSLTSAVPLPTLAETCTVVAAAADGGDGNGRCTVAPLPDGAGVSLGMSCVSVRRRVLLAGVRLLPAALLVVAGLVTTHFAPVVAQRTDLLRFVLPQSAR